MDRFNDSRTKTRRSRKFTIAATCLLVLLLVRPAIANAQGALETPLKQELLTLLTNEISGQVAFNNVVKLAGAPWLRSPAM